MFDPYDNPLNYDADDAYDADASQNAACDADEQLADDRLDAGCEESPAPANTLKINPVADAPSPVPFGANCGGTCHSEGGGEFGGAKYEYWYNKW